MERKDSNADKARMKDRRIRLVLFMVFFDSMGALALVLGFMGLVEWIAAIPVIAVAWANSGIVVWKIVLGLRAESAQESAWAKQGS